MSIVKTIIITGASSGIGLALAKAYLELGHNVVGNARTFERLEAAKSSIGDPENFLLVPGDIGRAETARRMFDAAIDAFGPVDVLVTNAGSFISKPVGDLTEEDVDRNIDTNLKGFLYPAQVASRHMSENGSGHIVAITACIAMQPNVRLPALLPVLLKGGLNMPFVASPSSSPHQMSRSILWHPGSSTLHSLRGPALTLGTSCGPCRPRAGPVFRRTSSMPCST